MNTAQVTRYHPVLVALHWTLAILIIADLTIGTFVLVHIPNNVPRKIEGLRAHMSAGMLILFLMTLRFAVRSGTARPTEAETGSAFLDRVAWASHRLLYVVVFAMALSGLGMALQAHLPEIVFEHRGRLPASFWIYPLRSVHFLLARFLIALIALHIAGALYHVFFRRDHLFRRMWFGRRRESGQPVSARRDGSVWQYSPWLTRAILAFPLLLFAIIGTKYVSEPVDVAAGSKIVLGSPAAVTDTREIGAVFLAMSFLILYSALSTRRLLAGLVLVWVVVGVVTAVRVLGVVVDGAAPETLFKLVSEVVLLLASAAGIAIELGRQRRLTAA